MTIAGHIMADTPSGRACSVCGRTWRHMLDNRDRWRVGQLEIAHYGALSANEVAELEAEVERIWAAVMAVGEV